MNTPRSYLSTLSYPNIRRHRVFLTARQAHVHWANWSATVPVKVIPGPAVSSPLDQPEAPKAWAFLSCVFLILLASSCAFIGGIRL